MPFVKYLEHKEELERLKLLKRQVHNQICKLVLYSIVRAQDVMQHALYFWEIVLGILSKGQNTSKKHQNRLINTNIASAKCG